MQTKKTYDQSRHQGWKGKQYSGKGKKNNEWNEESADSFLKRFFGNDYVSFLLTQHVSNYNDYIDKIKSFVRSTYKNMTSSQLRNVFSRVKKARDCKELMLLRPKIAYVAGRSESKDMKTMVFLLDRLIENVGDNPDKMERFQSFFEAVIAYHKYYGGKE